jgi:hypothetical protein
VFQQVPLTHAHESLAARLAVYFPTAMRVRIPVEIVVGEARGTKAVIEFGTANEVLFVSELPLEFNDRVRITNRDGSLEANGKVVAVQCESNRTAVAVRFDQEIANWIIKPSSSARAEGRK